MRENIYLQTLKKDIKVLTKEQNKETEEKNRQTMLNALFATITKQLEQKEKNALQ